MPSVRARLFGSPSVGQLCDQIRGFVPGPALGDVMISVTQYRVTLKKDRVLRVADVDCSSFERARRIVSAYYMREVLPHEEVIAVGLNGRNEVLGIVRVSQGGAHGAALTPVDVLRPLIAMGAAAFVLAHNHPSGDPTPSADDVAMTRRLMLACDAVGIALLDHVVIAGPTRAASVLEHMGPKL